MALPFVGRTSFTPAPSSSHVPLNVCSVTPPPHALRNTIVNERFCFTVKWTSPASHFGEAVLLINCLLCLAYIKSYRSMFVLFAKPRTTFGAPPAPTTAQPAGA